MCIARLLQEVIPSPGAAEKHKSWDDLHTAATRSWPGETYSTLCSALPFHIVWTTPPGLQNGWSELPSHHNPRAMGSYIRDPNPATRTHSAVQPPMLRADRTGRGVVYGSFPKKKIMRQQRATEGALTTQPRRYARLNNIKQQTTPSGQEAEHSTARGSAKENAQTVCSGDCFASS